MEVQKYVTEKQKEVNDSAPCDVCGLDSEVTTEFYLNPNIESTNDVQEYELNGATNTNVEMLPKNSKMSGNHGEIFLDHHGKFDLCDGCINVFDGGDDIDLSDEENTVYDGSDYVCDRCENDIGKNVYLLSSLDSLDIEVHRYRSDWNIHRNEDKKLKFDSTTLVGHGEILVPDNDHIVRHYCPDCAADDDFIGSSAAKSRVRVRDRPWTISLARKLIIPEIIAIFILFFIGIVPWWGLIVWAVLLYIFLKVT